MNPLSIIIRILVLASMACSMVSASNGKTSGQMMATSKGRVTPAQNISVFPSILPSVMPSVSSQPSDSMMPSCDNGKGAKKFKHGKDGSAGISGKGKMDKGGRHNGTISKATGMDRGGLRNGTSIKAAEMDSSGRRNGTVTSSKGKGRKGKGGDSCDEDDDDYDEDDIVIDDDETGLNVTYGNGHYSGDESVEYEV